MRPGANILNIATMATMREKLLVAIKEALKSVGVYDAEVSLEHPAELANGDYSTGVALQYAKQAGLSPRVLSGKIVEVLEDIDGVDRVDIAGPGFINFYLTSNVLAASLEKARGEDMWGANNNEKGKRIMVEYTDPNPFKEFHIGHLMSNAVGESVSRLLQFSGADIKRANYQGDVGPHVAKAIWGIKKLGVDPESAASLGRAYAAGAKVYEEDAKAKAEIDEINAKVYGHSDAEIDSIYTAGRKASLAHFEDIYAMLGTKFDYYFFESVSAPRGGALVREHPSVFAQSDGAVVFEGEKVGLHTRVFITSKGLPTYEAKDLGLLALKSESGSLDRSLTITAHEQAEYFKVVLAAAREIPALADIANITSHVTHGMMRFAEGKMSSRTGNVVTGESLLAELTEAAKERASESRADNPETLASQVAVAAIKYQVLRQASHKDIVFDKERALSLEGDSGPYLQYAHARAHALVEKAKEQGIAAAIDESAKPSELARLLHRFPEAVEYAAHELEPHLLTNYILELAAAFNSWYAQEQILDGTSAAAHKVAIADAVRKTLRNGLWVLGIPAPEKM